MARPYILDDVAARGLAVFESGAYNLNIVVERRLPGAPNRFDDLLHVVFRDTSGAWRHRIYPCTADPGLYYRDHPMNAVGTASVCPGQYRGAYKLGVHNASKPWAHTALVQQRPIKVWRDRDADGRPDRNGAVEEGIFAINVHRALLGKTATFVDRTSAGCIVLADDLQFAEFIGACQQQVALLKASSFTLTLIETGTAAVAAPAVVEEPAPAGPPEASASEPDPAPAPVEPEPKKRKRA